MNFLLFMLEIFLIVAVIALVPTRSELRTCRARVIHNGREQGNSCAPSSVGAFEVHRDIGL